MTTSEQALGATPSSGNNRTAQDWPATRLEVHYTDRVFRCFAQRPTDVFAMVENAVKINGEGEALVCGRDRLSWRALHQAAMQVAGGLAARNIQPGERIGLLAGNSKEFVITVLAAAALGAVVVPIGIREQMPGIQYILEHSGASVLIHDDELTDRVPLQGVPALKHRFAIGRHGAADGFDVLTQSGPLAQAAKVEEEDTAAILYTSGTTGKPKGAMLTHLGIVHSAMHFVIACGLGPSDRTAIVVPMSHVTGLVGLIASMVCCAGAIVAVPEFKAGAVLHLMAQERISYMIMVPAMYNLCLMQNELTELDLSSWRIGGYGGAPMPTATIAALAEKLPGLGLLNAYGATETTSPATILPTRDAGTRGASVGLTVHCGDIIIMGHDGRELARGETGEIWIRGPMVVKGYWNNPAATADNFTAGFWHSGDIGMMDEAGYVYVLDRSKDMINRGGYKIFSVEVENVLHGHPAIVEAAVVGTPCPVLGERVHAFIATRHEVDAAALQAHCARHLPDYKVPEGFTFCPDGLPRNANGKLLKRDLRTRLSAPKA
nr:acyl--CoA ligase [Pseudomonas sp.]